MLLRWNLDHLPERDKTNRKTSKKIDLDFFVETLHIIVFFFDFQLINPEVELQSDGAWLKNVDQYLTFTLQNPKAELKSLQHKTHLSLCKTALFLTKNCQFLHNADINKLKMVLVLMCVFCKTAYLSVHLCQYSTLDRR